MPLQNDNKARLVRALYFWWCVPLRSYFPHSSGTWLSFDRGVALIIEKATKT